MASGGLWAVDVNTSDTSVISPNSTFGATTFGTHTVNSTGTGFSPSPTLLIVLAFVALVLGVFLFRRR